MKEKVKNAAALVMGLLLILGIELFLTLVGIVPLKERDPFAGFEGSSPAIIQSSEQPDTFVLNPAKNKNFNDVKFIYPKPGNVFRIVSFGGSTTYGRPYIDSTSFPAWLTRILNQEQGSTHFENINMGGISYASYRVRRLAEEISKYNPDLYILYAGHNEFLESRTFEEIKQENSFSKNMRRFLHQSRLYTLVSDALAPVKTRNTTTLSENVSATLEQIGGYELYKRDEKFKQGVIGQFRFSVEEIIKLAKKKKIPLILCTVPSNLVSTSPFKSTHRDEMNKEEVIKWDALFNRAEVEFRSGNYKRALELVDEASIIDDSYAHLHFLRGHTLLMLNRPTEAKSSFIRAKDEDIVPLRALEIFNSIIRELAEKHGTPLADIESSFQSAAPDGLPGNEIFMDHVHPTIKGQQLIAWTILNTAVVNNLLPYNPISDERSRNRVLQYLQEEHARITPRYRAMGYWGVGRLFHWAGKIREAQETLLLAWEAVRDVAEIPYLLGDIELAWNNPERAMRFFEEARKIGGEETRIAYGAAQAAIQLENAEKALELLAAIPNSMRDKIRHDSLLGETFLLTGQFDDAIEALERAVAQAPRVGKFLLMLTKAYIADGQESLAQSTFKRYAELSNRDVQRYEQLRTVTIKSFSGVK